MYSQSSWYFVRKVNVMDNGWIGKTVYFHGIKCEVSAQTDKFHYRLIATGNEPVERLVKDKSFTEYHAWGAVTIPIRCEACGKVFWFDDTQIPIGDKYECECSNCNFIAIRKRFV